MTRRIDPQNLNLPIDLLNYAHNSLMKGWGRHGDLQETFHIYMDVMGMAIDEIERLSTSDGDAQPCNVAQRCSNGQATAMQPEATP